MPLVSNTRHLDVQGDFLLGGTLKETLLGELKEPLFDVTVSRGGSVLYQGVHGFLTVDGNRFVLELLVSMPEEPMKALELVPVPIDSSLEPGINDPKFVGYVHPIVPAGTLLLPEADGYHIVCFPPDPVRVSPATYAGVETVSISG